MAVGKHKYNWELELDAGRGPGTYNYEHAKGGPIKESHNWKWKRLEAFKEESDSELEVDAKENTKSFLSCSLERWIGHGNYERF